MKTQKYTRPLIVFKTPFYEPTYCEFRNPPELQKFLADFNFMRSHELTDWSVGRPEFQLGTRLEFDIDDYLCESNIKWGPRFIVGRNVRVDGKKILAEIPVDAASNNGLIVKREYATVALNRGMMDAVIDLHTMRQLWPLCESHHSELSKFFARVAHERYKIMR